MDKYLEPYLKSLDYHTEVMLQQIRWGKGFIETRLIAEHLAHLIFGDPFTSSRTQIRFNLPRKGSLMKTLEELDSRDLIDELCSNVRQAEVFIRACDRERWVAVKRRKDECKAELLNRLEAERRGPSKGITGGGE